MILGALLELLATVVAWVLDALPEFGVPGFVSNLGPNLNAALGYAGSVGSWVPLGYAATVAGVMLATKAIGFLIKLGRMVLSIFTGGGGSAA